MSFASLATVPVPISSTLFEHACNPSMDLVVTFSSKGKQRAGISRISLWRMSGNKVWDADVPGIISSLAWSPDGLYLSVMATDLHHLSVHAGEVIKTIKLQASDYRLKWLEGAEDWKKPEMGSALACIDHLPKVTPIDPPANPMFGRPAKHGPVPALDNLPSLLSPLPYVLEITNASESLKLLTGTVPLNSRTTVVAQSCDRVHAFLETLLRGVDSMELAAKESAKQNMIWMDELETCAQQQGTSRDDVHADLFKLLVTGRSGVAVSEWLGNRLTSRSLAKWETTMSASSTTIIRVISESMLPSAERVLLILEEQNGEVHTACGVIRELHKMTQKAREDMAAAIEWVKWLKYEIARAAAQDPSSDSLPTSLHDTKLVWYFMQSAFRKALGFLEIKNEILRLVSDCMSLSGVVQKTPGSPYPPPLFSERGEWTAAVDRQLVLVHNGHRSSYDVDCQILAVSFFDDLELALITSESTGCHLRTIEYSTLSEDRPIVFSRSRLLGPSASEAQLAVNGREGRRVAASLIAGNLEIFDMEANEDEPDEEKDEED